MPTLPRSRPSEGPSARVAHPHPRLPAFLPSPLPPLRSLCPPARPLAHLGPLHTSAHSRVLPRPAGYGSGTGHPLHAPGVPAAVRSPLPCSCFLPSAQRHHEPSSPRLAVGPGVRAVLPPSRANRHANPGPVVLGAHGAGGRGVRAPAGARGGLRAKRGDTHGAR